MPCSIYLYLKTSLHTALEKAYPEQYPHLSSIPITFSSITPDPLTDLATPYPLKISQSLKLPVTLVSQHLLNHFPISSDYLANTADTTFYRGFFNFRLSDKFLLLSLYETATINCQQKTSSSHVNVPEIIRKIELLLHTNTPGNLPSLDHFLKLPLPHTSPEHQASRLIALSSPDGIHSTKTGEYFKRRLLDEAKNCYRKCPIQCENSQLSILRFCITKSIYIRIMQMM